MGLLRGGFAQPLCVKMLNAGSRGNTHSPTSPQSMSGRDSLSRRALHLTVLPPRYLVGITICASAASAPIKRARSARYHNRPRSSAASAG